MTGDKTARVLTGLAVLAVAVIAAVVSFTHLESLALAHGQPLVDARLLPLSVDGLLVVSSLVLLAEARARRTSPGQARAGLVLGVLATVAANVTFGVHYGPVGAIVSGWPALAFIVSTEILVGQLRRAGIPPAPGAAGGTVSVPLDVSVDGVPIPPDDTALTVADPPVLRTVPSDAIEAAKVSMRATVAAGNALSQNQLAERFSLTRAQATKLHREVLAESNGGSHV